VRTALDCVLFTSSCCFLLGQFVSIFAVLLIGIYEERLVVEEEHKINGLQLMFPGNDDVRRLEEHSKFGAKFCNILALVSVWDLCILEGSLVDSFPFKIYPSPRGNS